MDESYDSVMIFEKGITIDDGPLIEGGNGICTIYGLLYNKAEMHQSNPKYWMKNILMVLAYIMGCERLQSRGGNMTKEAWYLPNGKVIKLTYAVKSFIFKTLLPELLDYRIMEFETPLDLMQGENDKIFLLSQSPLIRMGIVSEIQNNEGEL